MARQTPAPVWEAVSVGLWAAVFVSSEQPSTSWGHCLRERVSGVFSCPEFHFLFFLLWSHQALMYPCTQASYIPLLFLGLESMLPARCWALGRSLVDVSIPVCFRPPGVGAGGICSPPEDPREPRVQSHGTANGFREACTAGPACLGLLPIGATESYPHG